MFCFRVRKILNIRLFEDDNGKMWKCSVKEKNYEILCLSQITLYNRLKGNKPDFHLAMPPELSKSFYMNFLKQLKNSYSEDLVKEGIFGKHIVVGIQNDGPVTINLESPVRDKSLEREEQTVPNME
ncbi:hypothetical protein O3M35_002262 [Rhynocoris fuscipes]|uniref:D-aminoacyl-tRNA deacylase n=1 Tax=Rhynocoris fuscipes TaxID=488301 RepID=A0AAW1CRZ9_9HEMI